MKNASTPTLGFLLFLALTGCAPGQQMCATIDLDRSTEGLPLTRDTPGFRLFEGGTPGSLNSSVSDKARDPRSVAKGDVDHSLCCFSQSFGQTLSWCSAEQLACSEERFQGLSLAQVEHPYSVPYLHDDNGVFCFVLIKEERIIAVFSRYWS